MKFIFFNKSIFQTNIIVDYLEQENISYHLEEEIEYNIFQFGIFCEVEEDVKYNIVCNTDISHFEFIKYLVKNRIKKIKTMKKMYLKKRRGKNVYRVFKKNIANTNKRNKSK